MIEHHIKEIKKYPCLTRDQEIELSKKVKLGDKKARELMILSNLRLAFKIAKEFQQRSSCSFDDLIQESNLGLVKAVDLFDPARGHKFSTYATWWMKQRVRQHILGSIGVSRLPSNARQVLFKYKQHSEEYRQEFGCNPSYDELANIMGLTKQQLMGIISSTHVKSVDEPVTTGPSEGPGVLFGETIPDESIDDPIERLYEEKVIAAIKAGMNSLTPRERVVLRLRFGIIDDLKDQLNFNENNLITKNIDMGVE